MKFSLLVLAWFVSVDASAVSFVMFYFYKITDLQRVLIGKNLLSTYPLAHKQNVFEYQIVNIGNTSAINVRFRDDSIELQKIVDLSEQVLENYLSIGWFQVELHDRDSFPTDRFEILKGSPNTKFAEILPQMTVYHHVVVVPRNVQPIEDKNVTVDYTDSETKQVSHVSTLWYSKGRFSKKKVGLSRKLSYFSSLPSRRCTQGCDRNKFKTFPRICCNCSPIHCSVFIVLFPFQISLFGHKAKLNSDYCSITDLNYMGILNRISALNCLY